MSHYPELRFYLENEEDSLELGRLLAGLLREQSSPSALRAVYLIGDLGSGKTTLARGLVQALPGGDQAEAASPSFTLCNEYPTSPPVLHADLYRLGPGAALPEEMAEEMADDGGSGALLLLEWAEYLESRERAGQRLEIRLAQIAPRPLENLDIPGQSCERKRLAGVTGYGEAGKALLQRLQPHLESRFKPLETWPTLPSSKD